jgi:D-tyrosyl-tRNA(Tyr) deacylase
MRAVVQRVSRARVTVDGQTTGQVGVGMVLLLGVAKEDTERDADWMAEKVAGLRIFEDAGGKMNVDVVEAQGAVLAVSQFTLLGDVRKGKRPSFTGAAEPAAAQKLYERFCGRLREKGLRVETGVFQAMMDVEMVNRGPVTILLDSKRLF